MDDFDTQGGPEQANYNPPQIYGATWSTPLTIPDSDPGAWGVGGPGAQQTVGEFVVPGRMVEATLTLGFIYGAVNPTPPTGSVIVGPVYADVIVGYGTANLRFSMDWANGASISVPAGKVTVLARQGNRTIDYKISLAAALTPGPRAARQYATLTQYFAVPHLPGIQTVLVPARARGLVVPRVFTGIPSDFLIYVMRGDSTASDVLAVYNHADPNDAAIWTQGVQLSGAAYKLEIRSAVGLLADNANAIFLLDG